jgi:UDP:flavonoid glycosyltransferase YjiC (YdhE family)
LTCWLDFFFQFCFIGAQRVEKLGVGTHVASLDKKDIADALFKATTNKEQIEAAKALGKQVDSVSVLKKLTSEVLKFLAG